MELVLYIVLIGAIIIIIILSVQLIRYERELRRMAQFLDAHKNAGTSQLTTEVRSKGFLCLGKAVNKQLTYRHNDERTMKAKNRELRDGFAYLSHDIRTPLMGAKGYLQLQEEEEDPEERARYLQSVGERLDALQAILDQLFLFTQVSSADFTLECQEISLNRTAEKVLLSFYPQFEERTWTPEITLEEHEIHVLADPRAVERIFENLLGNALKHGADSPTITQNKNTLTFSNRVADPYSIDVDRLFDQFYKGEQPSRGQGGGLGLAIVRHLADSMDAHIEAHLMEDRLTITVGFMQ